MTSSYHFLAIANLSPKELSRFVAFHVESLKPTHALSSLDPVPFLDLSWTSRSTNGLPSRLPSTGLVVPAANLVAVNESAESGSFHPPSHGRQSSSPAL